MRAVWKFPLVRGSGPQDVRMPPGAQVLDVGVQEGVPVLWAVVRLSPDGSTADEHRTFCLVNTGQEIPDGFRLHRGSVVDPDSLGVWHLFEWQETGDKAAGTDMRGGPVP